MNVSRRIAIAGILGLLAANASAQEGGLPPAIRRALKKYRGSRVVSVRIRRGAPTEDGYMYEVTLKNERGERLVYVDPDDGSILFETEAVGR